MAVEAGETVERTVRESWSGSRADTSPLPPSHALQTGSSRQGWRTTASVPTGSKSLTTIHSFP